MILVDKSFLRVSIKALGHKREQKLSEAKQQAFKTWTKILLLISFVILLVIDIETIH